MIKNVHYLKYNLDSNRVSHVVVKTFPSPCNLPKKIIIVVVIIIREGASKLKLDENLNLQLIPLEAIGILKFKMYQ